MGNICRSPTAHGVFQQKVLDAGLEKKIEVDSAGTHAYHVGEVPDSRAQSTATEAGYDLSMQRARAIEEDDCDIYNYILVMDRSNLNNVRIRCHSGHDKVSLFLDYADNIVDEEVPDPYYGGANGFTKVLTMVESASEGLLDHIKKHHGL